MIHHEAWFEQTATPSNSRAAEEAIARLKRGDESALRDIHTLWLRGQVRDLDLVKILVDSKHPGHGFAWIARLEEFYSAQRNILRNRGQRLPESLFSLKSNIDPAYGYLQTLQSESNRMVFADVPSDQEGPGPERDNPVWGVPFKWIETYWKTADERLTRLEQAWADPELKKLAGWSP